MANTLNTEFRLIHIDGLDIPLKMHYDMRASVRVSINKDAVHIRLPVFHAGLQQEKDIDWAINWLKSKFHADPPLRNNFKVKEYHTGDIMVIKGQHYPIKINYTSIKNAKGSFKKGQFNIEAPELWTKREQSKAIGTILSKILSAKFLPEVTTRVHEVNDRFFQKKIGKVSMRLNNSIWGSCSFNGNISLSSRLLLTPQIVFDYLIVHELAHLVHHDHSTQFWNEVKRVMPGYVDQEKWLDDNDHQARWY